MKKISIIVPVYNEESIICEFLKRLDTVIKQLEENCGVEVVAVDDGSRDRSLTILNDSQRLYTWLKVVELRKNYGQTPALQAGLDLATGDILITMDSDLQHFPEEIPIFLKKLDEGYDMVCGWRRERQEGLIRRWPSKIANLCIKKISGLEIHDFGTTFRAYKKSLVKDIQLFGEFHRFIPVLGHLVGGRITEIPIQNIERPAGKSNYGIGRTFGVFIDLFLIFFLVRYMEKPLRLFGKAGILFLVLGLSIIVVLCVVAFVTDKNMVRERVGWFVMAAIFIVTSVQMILSGLLAEILIRVHFSVGGRQMYHIRDRT